MYKLFLLAALLWTTARAAPVAVLRQPLENAMQPQMAASADGTVHLVFGTRVDVPFNGKGRRPPTDGAIYYVKSQDLKTFTVPQKLADLPKIALGMRRGPRIAVTEKALIVTAESHDDGNVHAWLSTDSGQSWKEQPNLNSTSGSAKEGLHALAGNGRSLVAAAWLDDRSGGAEVWSRVSEDGGLTWQPERLVYRSPDGHVCQCCVPSVAVSPEGKIAIMWRNALAGSRDLFSTISTDGGRTFPPAQKLGAGTWPLNACPMDGGAITWTNGDIPEAVWRRELTIYLSGGHAAESKLAADAMQPLIVANKHGRHLLWEKDGNLILQLARSDPAPFAEKARAASFIALPDGRLAIAWESGLEGPIKLLFTVL